jgi:hypothetical protein
MLPMNPAQEQSTENSMTSYLWLIAVFAGWILLQTWILPKLDIPTCMSGACRTEQKESGPPKSP